MEVHFTITGEPTDIGNGYTDTGVSYDQTHAWPIGINTAGTLALQTSIDYTLGTWREHQDGTRMFIMGQQFAATFQFSWPPSSEPPLPTSFPEDGFCNTVLAINNAGDTLGLDVQWFSNEGRWRYRTLFNGQEIPALSDGTTVFPNQDTRTLNRYGLNDHGAFLVSGWVQDVANPDSWAKVYKYFEKGSVSAASGGSLHDAPEGILQMNGAHQAIGETDNYTTNSWNSWFGVQTSSGTWDTFPLLDLLKWTHKPAGTRDDWDKFHNALRHIRPKFIADADPATAGAVVNGRTFTGGCPQFVYFNAQALEAGNSATGQPDVWKSRNMVMELNPDGYYTLMDRRAIAGEDEVAPADALDFMASGNSSGTTIGNADNGTIRIVMKATEFEFVADNLYRGFDPPQHPGNDHSSSSPDRLDLNDPQWWTVISAPDGRPGGGAPFNTNTDVRIWRNTKNGTVPKMVAALKDATPPATSAAITVANNALEDQSNLTLNGVRCAAGRLPGSVVVQIYNRNAAGGKVGNAQAVLNVDVLPKRIIRLGLWHLDDHDPTTDDASPAYFLRGQQIIDRLNEVFKQACIEFTPAQLPAQVRPCTPYNPSYGDRLSGPNSSWGPIRYLDPSFNDHNTNLGSNALTLGDGTSGAGQMHVVLYRYMRTRENAAIKTLKPPDGNEPQIYGVYMRSPKTKDAIPAFRDRVFVQTAAFSPPGGVGYIKGGPEDPYYEDFLLTICHEVGHALGINVWNYKKAPDHLSTQDGHDYGAFPLALYHYDGSPVGWIDSPGLQPNERAPLAHRLKERAKNPIQVNAFYRNANTPLLPRSKTDTRGNKRRIASALMSGAMAGVKEELTAVQDEWAAGKLGRSLWMRHEDWREANKNAVNFENN